MRIDSKCGLFQLTNHPRLETTWIENWLALLMSMDTMCGLTQLTNHPSVRNNMDRELVSIMMMNSYRHNCGLFQLTNHPR